jgi:lysosomal Pro-X carboxypeptidase
MASAVGVFFNYSGALSCFHWGAGPNPESDEDGNFWDYQ